MPLSKQQLKRKRSGGSKPSFPLFLEKLGEKHDWKYCSSFNNLRLFPSGY